MISEEFGVSSEEKAVKRENLCNEQLEVGNY